MTLVDVNDDDDEEDDGGDEDDDDNENDGDEGEDNDEEDGMLMTVTVQFPLTDGTSSRVTIHTIFEKQK